MGLVGLSLASGPGSLVVAALFRVNFMLLYPLSDLGFLIAVVMCWPTTNSPVTTLEKSRVIPLYYHKVWAKQQHTMKHRWIKINSRIILLLGGSVARQKSFYVQPLQNYYCSQWSLDQVSGQVSVYRLNFSSFLDSTVCVCVFGNADSFVLRTVISKNSSLDLQVLTLHWCQYGT